MNEISKLLVVCIMHTHTQVAFRLTLSLHSWGKINHNMKYYIGILKLQINCSLGTYLTNELIMEHFATVTEKVESIFQFPTTLFYCVWI